MSGIAAEFSARLSGHGGAFSLDVALQLPGQGVIALFGPSGSGKTTLLRAMAGLESFEGRMVVNGETWQEKDTFLPVHRRPLGYVFQEASLFPHLTVRKNLEFGMKRIPLAERRIGLEEAVAWLGIEPLLSRRPQRLSGGERQRVAIARALLTSPALLLMDEPLAALDRQAKAEILPYLERLHRKLAMPVIYVSHAIEEVARLADHIVQLESGRVVAEGPAIELLSSLGQRPVMGEEPGAVIEAGVAMHDEQHHLTTLDLAGGLQLLAPRLAAAQGERVRIRIPAREVSISLAVPEGSSILNILPARIIGHTEADPGRVLVQLELERALEGAGADGQTRLLSRISHHSWQRLGLHEGMRVQAQIKSMGLAL